MNLKKKSSISIDWRKVLKENGECLYSDDHFGSERTHHRLDHDPIPNEKL